MKNIFFLLVLFCFGVSSYAQKQQQIDSLKNVIKTYPDLSSKEKGDIYLKLARLNRNTNPKEHEQYSRLSLKEFENTKDIKAQGISISEIATYFQRADMYDSAYFYYSKAIPYFKSEKNIANTYSRLSNIEKARGNFVESIALFIKSDSIYEKIGDDKGRVATNTNLGIILSTQGDFKKAIEYYKKAETHLDTNDLKTRSIIYTNFAITYNELGDLDNSKKYTELSMPIKLKLNDIIGIANAYGNLSMLASKKGDDIMSINYMEQALEAYKKMNNKNGVAGSYNTLGGVYRTQGNFKKAEHYLLLANELSKETKNHDALLRNNEALYKLYRDKNQWNKAYSHLETFKNLQDSFTEIEKIKITKELRTKYETDRILKDKALAETNTALAEQKAENNKSFAIAMAALGGLILVLALFGFYRFKAKKKQDVLALKLEASEKRLRLEQQTRISELKALQSQMNPHFVFNALNSIQDLILLQDIRNSNKYLGKFSDLIRRILVNSNTGTIPISEEIKTLQLYAELEQLRFGNQLEIHFNNEVPEAISDDFLLPTMFLQPYVENALKHGLLHKEGEKRLTVSFYMEENNVVCNIDDNGVGRKRAQEIKQKGQHLNFSTQANQERIDLLNAGRTNKISIDIVDKSDNGNMGTSVFLYFPFDEA